MTRSTTSLSFLDVNVWMAVILEHHVHRRVARTWWQATEDQIAFTRFTQISVLRLLTTSAAMDGKPLSMKNAWRAYDRLFEDARVVFYPEPPEIEAAFRQHTTAAAASPKVWADAWLLAFAETAAGRVVTLDRALTACGAFCLLES